MINLVDMAKLAFMLRDDIHCLHFNVRGIDFKDTHEYFGDLYEKALDDFDYFIERAILTEEIPYAPNMNEVLLNPNEITGKWEPIEAKLYTVEEAFEKLLKIGKDYCEALELCHEHCEKENYIDIASDIETMLGEWNVNIKYKVKATLGE